MNTLNTSFIKKMFFLFLLYTFFSSINFEIAAYYLTNSVYSFLLALSILTFLNKDIKVLFVVIVFVISVCAILTLDINFKRQSDTLVILYYYLFLVIAIKCISSYISGYKSMKHL